MFCSPKHLLKSFRFKTVKVVTRIQSKLYEPPCTDPYAWNVLLADHRGLRKEINLAWGELTHVAVVLEEEAHVRRRRRIRPEKQLVHRRVVWSTPSACSNDVLALFGMATISMKKKIRIGEYYNKSIIFCKFGYIAGFSSLSELFGPFFQKAKRIFICPEPIMDIWSEITFRWRLGFLNGYQACNFTFFLTNRAGQACS